MKNTITKKMLAMMLAVMITAAPVSSISFATEAPEGESTSVQQEVKVEKSEPAPAQETEKKEQAPAETSSAPAAQQTVTALADNEAPKAASEQISDSSVPMTIADNETPTAAPEAWALINLLCAAATAILSVIMLIEMFGRREDEDEETGERLEIRHRRAARVFSIFPAIGAIAAFLITEDMANPMVLTDNWTIVMAVILMIQIAVSVIAKKKKEEEEEYNTIG